MKQDLQSWPTECLCPVKRLIVKWMDNVLEAIKMFHLTNACCSTKAKTWNIIHRSCFFQIKMNSRTYILSDLPRDIQFRVCCSNTNSHYSHHEGLGQWPPNPATHHAPPLTLQGSHLSCFISTSRYVWTCLYFLKALFFCDKHDSS